MDRKLKDKLIALCDRRTVVSLIVCSFLFLLAFKSQESKAAIEGMVWVSIALIGSNAAQRSLTAFSRPQKTKTTKA